MKEEHIQWFNLGMAPLSNVGTSRKSFTGKDCILGLRVWFSFYSFHGLREYKSKYATNWVSRYTLYSRDSWIAYVMIALLIIDNAPVEQTQGRISGLKNGYEESIKTAYR